MNFILWTADADIFTIPGLDREVRWYGLLFAAAFYLGSLIIARIFKKEGHSDKVADNLLVYIIIGTVAGARLGHVLFYGPYFDEIDAAGNIISTGYLSHPFDILKVWEGGLASHGAGFGLLLACFLFARKYKVSFKWLIDRIVIVVALSGCLIRFGNFMNSEIIGKTVENGSGFVFIKNTERQIIRDGSIVSSVEFKDLKKDTVLDGITYPKLRVTLNAAKNIDQGTLESNYQNLAMMSLFNPNYNAGHRDIKVIKGNTPHFSIQKGNQVAGYFDAYVITRHPSQLYEALSSIILFIILILVYKKLQEATPEGLLAGIFFIYIFTLRFFYEFLKENQVDMENDMLLNMGQKLSIPMVLFGIYLVYNALKKKKESI